MREKQKRRMTKIFHERFLSALAKKKEFENFIRGEKFIFPRRRKSPFRFQSFGGSSPSGDLWNDQNRNLSKSQTNFRRRYSSFVQKTKQIEKKRKIDEKIFRSEEKLHINVCNGMFSGALANAIANPTDLLKVNRTKQRRYENIVNVFRSECKQIIRAFEEKDFFQL